MVNSISKSKRTTKIRSNRPGDDNREIIAKERDKINAILNAMGDGLFAIDDNSIIYLFNAVAAEISGYSAKEAIGKRYDKIMKFVSERDVKVRHDRFIQEILKGKKSKGMPEHTVLIRKDGTRVPVVDSASPLKGKSGKISGCVIVFRDETREREIDKMKTDFVSVASHQLRTPLTAIRWFIEELMNEELGKLNSEQKGYLQQVNDSNIRMINLVNDLLNVSRIETGRLLIEPKFTDVINLIRSVIDDLSPIAKAKNCHVRLIRPGRKIAKIKVDPSLLRQVIHNLLNNSIKYSKGRGNVCSISIKIEVKFPDLHISVRDTGVGVSSKDKSHIFEKFFRADNVIKLETEGSGLGLYISKMIVESMGGRIWFESSEDKGTIFYFTIPLAGSRPRLGKKRLV